LYTWVKIQVEGKGFKQARASTVLWRYDYIERDPAGFGVRNPDVGAWQLRRLKRDER